MVAGDAPDVYQLCCWQSTFFVQNGQALNVQPYIDRDAEEVNIDDFYSKEFEPWTLNGDIHFMPYYTGTVVIYYNKDMFDEAGVDYPPSKWGELTFDAYRAMANKFVKREKPLRWGTSNYGHGANWLTQYWLRGFGAHMVDPDDHDVSGLCKPEALECLEDIRQMIHEEHSFAQGAEMGGVGVQQLFTNGSSAMMEIGSWAIPDTVTGAAEFTALEGEVTDWVFFPWDIAPMWKGPGGITTHQSVDGQGVWSGTPYPEESWQLSKEIASAKFEELNITIGEGLPAVTQVGYAFLCGCLAQEVAYPGEGEHGGNHRGHEAGPWRARGDVQQRQGVQRPDTQAGLRAGVAGEQGSG